MTEINTSNINRVWADLMVEELVRSGAGLFCLAPGSRSTPLATAVAANPRADHVIHFDERGTAFCALGYARATRRPAVWVTTSGTAVANGLPAAVEASVDGVPMILLTADRPPELRDSGANQTIDQVKLFGAYVRWQFDLPAPDSQIDPSVVLTTIDQAVYRARRTPAGPVHLNAMFREPLAPDDDGQSYEEYLRRLSAWQASSRPYSKYAHPKPLPDVVERTALWAALKRIQHGIVVVGRLDSAAQADAVRWLSERLAWPMLPDVGSQLRLHAAAPNSAPYYDLVLASTEFKERHRPDAVLMFGSRSTSKRLGQFLASAQPDLFVCVRESSARLDPNHQVTHQIEADIVTFCDELVGIVDGESAAEKKWLDEWKKASAKAEEAIDELIGDELSEPACARLITTHAPEGSGLVLASSMPVRDADQFGRSDGNGPVVAANRGASGIDGTVATAAGFARGLRSPTTLLIGDLALLHDLNSLALLRRSPDPVIVVVVNNHGGGIFSFLPIARHDEVFEPFFGTPHEHTFEHAAHMFDLPYRHVSTCVELEDAYVAALQGTASHVIEITTDRRRNLELHRRIEEAAARTLA